MPWKLYVNISGIADSWCKTEPVFPEGQSKTTPATCKQRIFVPNVGVKYHGCHGSPSITGWNTLKKIGATVTFKRNARKPAFQQHGVQRCQANGKNLASKTFVKISWVDLWGIFHAVPTFQSTVWCSTSSISTCHQFWQKLPVDLGIQVFPSLVKTTKFFIIQFS